MFESAETSPCPDALRRSAACWACMAIFCHVEIEVCYHFWNRMWAVIGSSLRILRIFIFCFLFTVAQVDKHSEYSSTQQPSFTHVVPTSFDHETCIMSHQKVTNKMMESSEEEFDDSGIESDDNMSFANDGDFDDEDDDDDDDHVDNSSNPVDAEPKDKYKDVKENIGKFRDLCGAFVNHEKVQLFIVVLIGINAAMMGIGTFDFDKDIDAAFYLADKVFLSIFTAELGLQMIYHGFRLFLDGWLVFDFVIIFISWTFNGISIIRAFRIFRALRLVTRVKVMKNLVLALFSVLPKMGAIGLLLFLISYIFAVMFTQLFKEMPYLAGGANDPEFPDYYGRLDRTFFTLFQLMTLDGWSAIARETIDVYPSK
jgi:Ion transport protein